MILKTLKTVFQTIFVGIILSVLYLSFQVVYNPAKTGEYIHEDIGLSIEQLVKKHGYALETHTVTTEDGYILEMHRIPYKTITHSTKPRPAILLMHGLTMDSPAWLLQGPGLSPAYYFVDQGYDVWLGNARGNVYSRKHLTLDPDMDRQKFWNFSWNEIGYYDLPAKIDHIREVTGQDKIFYAGHSQGCVSFFVMLSERPEYNAKIRLMIALAPVVYTNDVRTLTFRLPAAMQRFLEVSSEYFNIRELVKTSETRRQIINIVCTENSWVFFLCLMPFGITGGYNNGQTNKTYVPLLMSHYPGGAGLRQLLHYTQVLNTDEFKKYDFGKEQNLEVYGQNTPPFYNFGNMKANVSLYFGENDYITSRRDHEHLTKNLPNIVRNYVVPDKEFNHFDFLYAIDQIDLLYKDIMKLMQNY